MSEHDFIEQQEAMARQARSELEENGVRLFKAEIHSFYGDGTINIKREHNIQPDGTIPPDNAPSVVVDTAQNLSVGDTVICILSGGHTYVLGRLFTPSRKNPEWDFQSMKAWMDGQISRLDSKIDSFRGTYDSFVGGHVGANSTHSSLNDLISTKLPAEVFQNFHSSHTKGPTSPHGVINTELSRLGSVKSSKGHRHGWNDLPKKGVHGNQLHDPNFTTVAKVDEMARAEAYTRSIKTVYSMVRTSALRPKYQ